MQKLLSVLLLMTDSLAESIGAALRGGIRNQDPALLDSPLRIRLWSQTFLHLLLRCPKDKLVSFLTAGPDQRRKGAAAGKARDPGASQQGAKRSGLHPSWSQQPPPPSRCLIRALFHTVEGGNTYTTKLCISIHFLLGLCSCFFDIVGTLLTRRENAYFGTSCP